MMTMWLAAWMVGCVGSLLSMSGLVANGWRLLVEVAYYHMENHV